MYMELKKRSIIFLHLPLRGDFESTCVMKHLKQNRSMYKPTVFFSYDYSIHRYVI